MKFETYDRVMSVILSLIALGVLAEIILALGFPLGWWQ